MQLSSPRPPLHFSPREPGAGGGREARAPVGRGAAPCAGKQPIGVQQVAGRRRGKDLGAGRGEAAKGRGEGGRSAAPWELLAGLCDL